MIFVFSMSKFETVLLIALQEAEEDWSDERKNKLTSIRKWKIFPYVIRDRPT